MNMSIPKMNKNAVFIKFFHVPQSGAALTVFRRKTAVFSRRGRVGICRRQILSPRRKLSILIELLLLKIVKSNNFEFKSNFSGI